MNKFIKQQLDSIAQIDIPEYNDQTTQLIIKKQDIKQNYLQQGKSYIIQLKNYIVNPPTDFTLHINWNNGVIPKSKYLSVTINKIMGKMYQVDACGYDWENQTIIFDSYSNLWLPKNGFEVKKEL